MRSEAEQLLKADNKDITDTELLKAKLLQLWSNLNDIDRNIYEKKEADDKKR